MSIYDGGPAYPISQSHQTLAPGMSLRDAMALSVVGHIYTLFYQSGEIDQVDVPGAAALASYELADAMLKARAEGNEQ